VTTICPTPPGAVDDGDGGWWADSAGTDWAQLPPVVGDPDPYAMVCDTGSHHHLYRCSGAVDHQGMHVAEATVFGPSDPRVVAVWR